MCKISRKNSKWLLRKWQTTLGGYFFCRTLYNSVIRWHPASTEDPSYIRDPASIGDPACIRTTDLDPRLVLETRLLFKTRLLLEVLR